MEGVCNPLYDHLPANQTKSRPVPAPRRSIERKKQQVSSRGQGDSKPISSISEDDDEVYYADPFASPPPSFPPPPLPENEDIDRDPDELERYIDMRFVSRPSISGRPPRATNGDGPSKAANGSSGDGNGHDEVTPTSSNDSYCQYRSNAKKSIDSTSTSPPPIPPRSKERLEHSSSASSSSNSMTFNTSIDEFDKVFAQSVTTNTGSSTPSSTIKASPLNSEANSASPTLRQFSKSKAPLHRSHTMPVIPLSIQSTLMSVVSPSSQTIAEDGMNDRTSLNSNPSAGSSNSGSSSRTNKYGFLYKTGPERKNLLRRWFTLDANSLTYYSDDPVLTVMPPKPRTRPTGVIYLKDVTMISVSMSPHLAIQPNSRFQRTFSVRSADPIGFDGVFPSHKLWYFEVGVNSHKGRQFLFAANSEEEGREWLQAISYAIGPKVSYGTICSQRVQCCGYLKAKQGISGLWVTCWLILAERQMYLVMYLADADESGSGLAGTGRQDTEEEIMYDMRKVMSVSYATFSQVGTCPTVTEMGGQPIAVYCPNETTVYLQGQYKAQTDSWFKIILDEWLVPAPGQIQEQFLTSDNVPVAIDKCIKFISTYGGLTTKGIYRIPGSMSTVKPLFDILKSNTKRVWDMRLRPEDGYTVHDVVSSLKMYLQSFDECLFTDQLLSQWLSNNVNNDKEARLKTMKQLLGDLPLVNHCTLRRIIGHLHCIVENSSLNEMVTFNLATVISTTLFFCSVSHGRDCNTMTSSAIDIVSDLIANYNWLFDISEEERAKEKQIFEALEALSSARDLVPKSVGDILVGVYVGEKDCCGNCINVRLSPTTTACEVVKRVAELAKLKDDTRNLSVYEVVCDGQLERVLHYSDLVLSITLSWSVNWSQDDAKQCYLVVKDNRELFTKLKPYLQLPPGSGGLNMSLSRMSSLPFSLFSELKFSDINCGKNYKKVVAEVLGTRLVAYTNLKASKVIGEWNIESLVWYIGAERRRLPPTAHCFTILETGQKIERKKDNGHFVGRVLCCHSEDDLHKWISAMIITEHPEGLYPLQKTSPDLI